MAARPQMRMKCPKCKSEWWYTPGGIIPAWDHCKPAGRTVRGKWYPVSCFALKPKERG